MSRGAIDRDEVKSDALTHDQPQRMRMVEQIVGQLPPHHQALGLRYRPS